MGWWVCWQNVKSEVLGVAPVGTSREKPARWLGRSREGSRSGTRIGRHQIQVVVDTVCKKGSLSSCVLSGREPALPEKPPAEPQDVGPRGDGERRRVAGGATETKPGEVSRKREMWQKGPSPSP